MEGESEGLRQRWQGAAQAADLGGSYTPPPPLISETLLDEDEMDTDRTGPPPPMPPTPSAFSRKLEEAKQFFQGEDGPSSRGSAVVALIEIVQRHPVGVPVLLVAASPFLLLLLPLLLLALAGGTIYVIAMHRLLSSSEDPPVVQAEDLDAPLPGADAESDTMQIAEKLPSDIRGVLDFEKISEELPKSPVLEIEPPPVVQPTVPEVEEVVKRAFLPDLNGATENESTSRPELGNEVLIVYGSQTGTASDIARSLQGEAASKGVPAKVMAMDEMDRESFPSTLVLLVITSSTGDGDPPDNCARFYRWISQRSRPKDLLKGVSFAVVGLGDSNYTSFMAVPRAVRRRLRDLGGHEFLPYIEADEVDGVEEKIEPWRKQYLWDPVVDILKRAQARESAQDGPKSDFIESTVASSTTSSTTSTTTSTAAPAASPAAAASDLPALEGVPALAACRVRVRRLESAAAERTSEGQEATDLACISSEKFEARVTDARYLTSDAAERRVLHVEMDISGSNSTYRPGDSIAISPRNQADVVARLIALLGFTGREEELFVVDSAAPAGTAGSAGHLLPHVPRPCSVREVFASCLDITGVARKSFLRSLAETCSDPLECHRLKLLSSRTGREEYKREILEGQPGLCDILEKYPSCKPSLDLLVDGLPPLVPRSYSITCAPQILPDRVQVAFTVVDYTTPAGYQKRGVATTWLESLVSKLAARQSRGGEVAAAAATDNIVVQAQLKTGGHFHPPADQLVPIIMIGPGTGVAPFRGFLQERRTKLMLRQKGGMGADEPAAPSSRAEVASNGTSNGSLRGSTGVEEESGVGEAWLFFGNRREDEDFLYKEDLLAFEEDGTLTQLLLAWSRQGPDKVYVQHRLLEHAADVYKIVAKEGGYVFVCGDGASMAKDVNATLVRVLSEQGGTSVEASTALLNDMVKQGRYVRDIWS